MIEKYIMEIVEDHYHPEQRKLLMLADLGGRLAKAKQWPLPPEDRRSLRDVIDTIPTLSVQGDPDTESFLAVVRKGEEQRILDAIASRHLRFFLRGLPRALLIAFSLEKSSSDTVFVQLGERVTYIVGQHVTDDNVVPVEEEFRLPGLEVNDIDALPNNDAMRLDANIRNWCARHDIDPDQVRRKGNIRTGQMAPATKVTSALERLYAAQEPEIARRMTVPIDIALALSKLP